MQNALPCLIGVAEIEQVVVGNASILHGRSLYQEQLNAALKLLSGLQSLTLEFEEGELSAAGCVGKTLVKCSDQ